MEDSARDHVVAPPGEYCCKSFALGRSFWLSVVLHSVAFLYCVYENDILDFSMATMALWN